MCAEQLEMCAEQLETCIQPQFYLTIQFVTLRRLTLSQIYYYIFLLTCLLITYSRDLLEKLTGFQLFKKFSAFCGTPKFITAFKSARHLSLSLDSSIQSIPSHPTS